MKYSREEWRQIFGAVSKYCAIHRAPGEKQSECVSKYLNNIRHGGRLPKFLALYVNASAI